MKEELFTPEDDHIYEDIRVPGSHFDHSDSLITAKKVDTTSNVLSRRIVYESAHIGNRHDVDLQAQPRSSRPVATSYSNRDIEFAGPSA